jgi:MoaA/NifB/PqqE/SkfB family radical SAM enzyme
MYKNGDYIKRGSRFVHNQVRPSHKKLSTLMLYVTDLCDSACKHCLIWQKRPVSYLPKEKIIEIMSSKCVTSNTQIGLEGGEFMLHPDALEILEWFHHNHPKFDLLSNCLKPELLIESVLKYPPKRLYLSLDGTKETYEHMRGKDGYGRVIEVIEKLKDHVPISIMFTLSPYNDFADAEHVIEVCESYDIDMRIGIYNDISFFDTVDKAHSTTVGSMSYNPSSSESTLPFKEQIPESIKRTTENYDFLLLYDEWQKSNCKLKCYSILDSLSIHPNGNVPVCQNLDKMLGNLYDNSLDEIFNSSSSNTMQKDYVHNCNGCWVNFHRKYDVILFRSLEKMLPKWAIEKVFGEYQWTEDAKMTYKKYMANN